VSARFAVNEPTAVGRKFTEMSHELPEVTLVTLLPWQAAVIENGPVLGIIDWSEMLSALLPVFVTVSFKVFWLGGFRPTFSFPKSSRAGISFTVPGAIVIFAVKVFVESATDVAVSVAAATAGTVPGAA
jgi:hypothetical protein